MNQLFTLGAVAALATFQLTAQASPIVTIDHPDHIEVWVVVRDMPPIYGGSTRSNSASSAPDTRGVLSGQIKGIESRGGDHNGGTPNVSLDSKREIAMSDAESIHIELEGGKQPRIRGEAIAMGTASASLIGAVGTALAAVAARARVVYGPTVEASGEAGLAIAAGLPGQLGITTKVIGISMNFVMANGASQSDTFMDIDSGLRAPGREVAISYSRDGHGSWNTNMGTACADWACFTGAYIQITDD